MWGRKEREEKKDNHPQNIKTAWSLESPVVAMEIDAGKLFEITEK